MNDQIHTMVVGEWTGDSWRNRWDSLRLFTPARYSGLNGMPFPAPPTYYPTKGEMADYLEEHRRTLRTPDQTSNPGRMRLSKWDGVRSGLPILEDDCRMEVANVIWATGYDSGFRSCIGFDVFEGDEPSHDLGMIRAVPGFYFVGLPFLHTPSSGMFHGVGHDAGRVVDHIASRTPVATAQWAGSAQGQS